MQGFVRALELEIKERNALIELLEHADSFYETQKGEAKVVANVSMVLIPKVVVPFGLKRHWLIISLFHRAFFNSIM